MAYDKPELTHKELVMLSEFRKALSAIISGTDKGPPIPQRRPRQQGRRSFPKPRAKWPSRSAFIIMEHIARHPKRTLIGDISVCLGIEFETVQRLIRQLIDSGYVEQYGQKRSARRVLTPKGTQALKEYKR